MTEASTTRSESILIGERQIGDGSPTIVVAEIGPNHNGDPELAARLVELAATSGADAVKFQYRIADAEIFDRSTKSYYFDESRYDFIKRVQEFPHDFHRELRDLTRKRGMLYICSAMCEEAIEKIVDLDADAIKIPSGEVGNPWLLERAAASQLPIIASSGMSPVDEIDAMMESLKQVRDRLILLHCLSEYPTKREDMNLNMIPELRERYGCPVGLSDHSRNVQEVAASTLLGAAVIEVHFTVDRNMVGPDHGVSLLPDELEELTSTVRRFEQAAGDGIKRLGEHASVMRESFTNSIVARNDLCAGDILGRGNLALKKPGTGLDPTHLPDLLGRCLVRDVASGTPLTLSDVE